MKKNNRLTEHYLLPLNLCFLSFFGVFLIYELDKWVLDTGQSSTFFKIATASLATVLLAGSINYRNLYFHLTATLFSLAGLMVLFLKW